MQFNNIIGQERIKRDLVRLAASEKVPHALLFLGPEGSGKMALAIAFAQYLLCESPSREDSCGHCNACRKVSKLIHADLHFSYPTIGRNMVADAFSDEWRSAISENPYLNIHDWLSIISGDKENQQGNINKEECLAIIKKLSLKAFESDRKVLILWMPELLQKEGNRLLKIIEEPPQQTFFLLVAEDQEQILNTILSRCQLIKVNALKDEDVVEGIRSKVSDQKMLSSLALLAGGNLNEALKLARDQQNDNETLFVEWFRLCYQNHGIEMLKWSEKMAKLSKENQKHFFRYCLHFLRELLALKLIDRAKIRLSDQQAATAKRMGKIIDIYQLELLVDLFSACQFHLERNANSKVLFLDTSIQVKNILRNEQEVKRKRYKGTSDSFTQIISQTL